MTPKEINKIRSLMNICFPKTYYMMKTKGYGIGNYIKMKMSEKGYHSYEQIKEAKPDNVLMKNWVLHLLGRSLYEKARV